MSDAWVRADGGGGISMVLKDGKVCFNMFSGVRCVYICVCVRVYGVVWVAGGLIE